MKTDRYNGTKEKTYSGLQVFFDIMAVNNAGVFTLH